MSEAPAPTIVICPFATPNGPLHVGHLAGPYLAADVHARYLRARGTPVLFPGGVDENQTYVVSTAQRLGVTPEALCAESADGVRRSIEAAGISVDAFVPAGDSYRRAVVDFVSRLHAGGKLRLRDVALPYSEAKGEYLLDGLVAGECPMCLATTCGGVCESCGHPVDYSALRNLRSTLDPDDPVTLRREPLLVLPAEEYRDRLAAFHADRPFRWRPHIEQLITEMLERPLLDFPVTYPLRRGIPAPFPETPGHVINPWVEAMPQSMHGAWYAGGRAGEVDGRWRADAGPRVVYFLGYDNAPNWAMTYIALLMAHADRYVLPSAIVCNEFYELEYDKVSTSRRHVVWATDLMAKWPRDLARFYLARTAPENQRTSFDRFALESVATRQLVEPWNELAAAVAELGTAVPTGTRLDVSLEGKRRAATMTARFAACFELPTFSLTRAAATLSEQIQRLHAVARDARGRDQLGDLALEVQTLVACAAPILVDAAEQALRGGMPLTWPGDAYPDSIELRRLPRLPSLTDHETRTS